MSKKINLPTTQELAYRKSANVKYYSTSWKCKMSKKELMQWLECVVDILKTLGITTQQEVLLNLTNIEATRETHYSDLTINRDIHRNSKKLFIKVKNKVSKFKPKN